MRVCNNCQQNKPLEQFPIRKDTVNPSYRRTCTDCMRIKGKSIYHTKLGLIKTIYKSQKQSVVRGRVSSVGYTLNELVEWCMSQEIFHTLHENWSKSGYERDMCPSCDRIDDYLGYEFSNITLMTWKQNRDKFNRDKISGKNNKISKVVLQIDGNGNVINRFHSSRDASRKLGISQSTISSWCRGVYLTNSSGYLWTYE